MQDAPPRGPFWWQWLTIVSLDATLVGLAWQALFADLAHVHLRVAERFVLGSSIWLAYTADRWIEGWRLGEDSVLTQRHRFAARWRWPLLAFATVVLAADVFTAFQALTERELRLGFALLAAVLLYVFSHQLVLATAFGVLCFCNCALISLWEREVDERQGQDSLARTFGSRARAVRALPWLISLVSLTACARAPMGWAAGYGCVAGSAALLGAVDRLERRAGRQPARVLADVVLLTPIIPLLLWSLH